MNLYGEILKEPKLRFSFSSNFAVDTYPKRGLLKYGPYDSNLINKDSIKCTILFSEKTEREKQILIDGLTKGEGNFEGFQSFFRVSLCIQELSFNDENIEFLIDQLSTNSPDIVLVLLKEKNQDIYKLIKSKLLGNGIPNQIILAEKLNCASGKQYILENIALASYAKVGGTPWTIATDQDENNLILGVSRACDHARKYLVGFVVLFTNDGDFLLMNSKAPVIEWEKYVEGLSELVEKAIYEYEYIKGTPDTIIIHFHKNPGRKEIESIENALKRTSKNIPYAILHLNEYSNFRLFDSSHYSFVPPKGLKVNLSTHEALLLLDGRIGDKRTKIGVPRVLDIRMDKRSTIDVNKFPELVQQVYNFSHINWRAFNVATIPVTINYSKLIAKMVIEIGPQRWNQIVSEGKLRDKSWFL